MNSKIYSQLDSRWSSLPYPTKASSFGGNGCGCCACLHVIIELDKYKNWTPKNLRPWMVEQGLAVPNQGTLWSGIPKTLQHFGFGVINHQTMTDIFDTLNKRKKEGKACLGVILFGSGTRGGITWTSGGHYVAFVDYKIANGKHYFYTKDSGGRKHSGWYCYETQMKGLIPQIWSASKPNEKTTTNTSASTSTSTSSSNKNKLVVDGVAGAKTILAAQEFFGTPQTGEFGGQLKSLKKYHSGFGSVIEYGSGGSALIKAMQKYLKLSSPDGQLGPDTIKATQKLVGVSADGYWGSETSKAFQTWLNRQFKSKSPTNKKSSNSKTSKETIKVIDVSYCQSSINWARVKNAGIKGAIVRCGFRGYESGKLQQDSMFLNHLKGAKAAGLKVGVYFFTEGINAKEGKEEADYTIKLIKNAGIKLDYPIAIDTEHIRKKAGEKEPRANNLSKAKRTEVIKAFCEQIKVKGYEPMVYASTAWLNNNLDMSKLPYKVWCAQYYSKCEYKGKYVMWQYTSSGKVDGVKSDVDMNYWYGE